MGFNGFNESGLEEKLDTLGSKTHMTHHFCVCKTNMKRQPAAGEISLAQRLEIGRNS